VSATDLPDLRRADRARARAGRDPAAGERLLKAAKELFSERGLDGVTIRDLSRQARTSVAAVNYHFGDKLGLYREVLEAALSGLREDATITVAEGLSPEDRLRHYVRTWVPRLAAPSGDAVWAQKLMRQEMNDPTPLAPWIAEQVVLPRIRFLKDAVAELLGSDADDPRVRRCVVSLQAQCLVYMPNKFRQVAVPGWQSMGAAEIEAAASHIAEFTLGGIAALRDE